VWTWKLGDGSADLRREQLSRRLVVATVLAVGALTLVASVSSAQQPIRIVIDKTGGGACDGSMGDQCDLFVQDRGVGACRVAKSGGGGVGTFCHTGVRWQLTVQGGPLEDDHLVVVQWRPQGSSANSHLCFDSIAYALSGNPATATATLSADPACTGRKMTWLYDVVLYKAGVEIERDDPGVLIED